MRCLRNDPHLPRVALDDPVCPPNSDKTCRCLHCGDTFQANQMEWIAPDQDPEEGMWYCPNQDCDGMGYGVDIHPMKQEEQV